MRGPTSSATRWTDLGVAGVLTVVGQVEIALGSARAEPVLIAATLCMTLALALRRRWPLAVIGGQSALFAAKSVLGSPPDATVTPVLSLIVGTYSVGVHAQVGRAVAGVALAACAVWVALLFDPPFGFSDVAYPLIGLVVPWAAGRAVHALSRRTADLERHAVELNEQHAEQSRAAIAAERRRIARELHDVISNSVSVMVLQAGAAERVMGMDPGAANTSLASIQTTGRRALEDLGSLLGFLREGDDDVGLSPQPTLAELEPLIQEMRRAGLEVRLRVEGERVPLASGIEVSAYRVVQEALANVRKHAGPVPVEVALRYSEHALEVEVSDAGSGTGSGLGTGHGLAGLRERVAAYGGHLSADRRPDGGFTLHARMELGRAL